MENKTRRSDEVISAQMDTELENFRISKTANGSFCRIPSLSDSKAFRISEFRKTLSGFRFWRYKSDSTHAFRLSPLKFSSAKIRKTIQTLNLCT